MHGLGYAAAVLLAAVFGVAAVAKLRDRTGTAGTFRGLGLPAGLATVVPVVELALAAGLVVAPGWSAAFALALLAAFTTLLARAVRDGVAVPCNCFGSARHEPVSWVELVRNAQLAVVAVVALTASAPTWPQPGATVTTVSGVLVGRWMLQQAQRRQEAGRAP